MGAFTKLDDILSKDVDALINKKYGEFESENLGTLPYANITHDAYKQAKKDCIKMVPDGTGGMVPEVDDDKLMVKVIIAGIENDDRSDFTFANKALIEKLGVATAEQAASKLLLPGEISRLAIAIQDISGFSAKAVKEIDKAVKNY